MLEGFGGGGKKILNSELGGGGAFEIAKCGGINPAPEPDADAYSALQQTPPPSRLKFAFISWSRSEFFNFQKCLMH